MNEPEERVILVDPADAEIGTAEKLEAHLRGALHRAFSVFVLDASGHLLLQRRAEGKYHTPGLWTNSCCGHPRPGEATALAARRRLREEMGIEVALSPVFAFTYRAEMEGGLVEHEIDHVFVGWHDGAPHPDPGEVGAWRWATPAEIRAELGRVGYTPWFAQAFEGLMERLPL